MKVFVLTHNDAENFIPEDDTLAIRIFDTFPDNDGRHSLQKSKNWVNILRYTFDDIELDRYSDKHLQEKLPEWEKKFKLFNTDIATRIVKDFSKYLTIPQLMIHCTFGWKRSPAVTRGLEKVFDLDLEWGNSRTQRIMTAEPRGVPWQGNSYVYKLLCRQKSKKG